jgi:purine-binding chemotaxis protein CheW
LGSRQIVVLMLDGTKFGIDMNSVKVIERPFEVYKVPGVPPYIEGLSDIRGEVHTIINLRKRLGLPGKDFDEDTRIVIVEAHSSLIGLLVDSASSIIMVNEEDIEAFILNSEYAFLEHARKFVNAKIKTPAGDILMLEPESLVRED